MVRTIHLEGQAGLLAERSLLDLVVGRAERRIITACTRITKAPALLVRSPDHAYVLYLWMITAEIKEKAGEKYDEGKLRDARLLI